MKLILTLLFFAGWLFTFWKVIVDRPGFMRSWNKYSISLLVGNVVCFFGTLLTAFFKS